MGSVSLHELPVLSARRPAGLASTGGTQREQEVGLAEVSAPGRVRSQATFFKKVFANIEHGWRRASAEQGALEERIPADYRNLLDAQRSFYNLNLKTQLLTKLAETTEATLRRLQQGMGN